MRILLANTGHPARIKGGAEAAVLDLAAHLAGKGHDVALAVHHDGRAHERFTERGVRVHALPNRNLYYAFDGRHRPAPARLAWHVVDGFNPWMASAFGRVIREERPEIVNTHALAGLSPALWFAARRHGLPVVHYLHEYGALCPRGSTFRNGRLCASACAPCGALNRPRRAISRLVDTAVGVSRFTLDRHLAWGFFPNAEHAVLPNLFLDLPAKPAPRAPRGSVLRLGYFGRLVPDKGAHLLLDALRRLPAAGWSLDVAGTGDESYVAQLRASAPPGVRFLGWTAATEFFPQIDLLVVPSLWPDPQPRVIFEAYGHGVPVLGARVGGIPEQIDEERTGWLFKPDVASLAEALARRLRAGAGADTAALTRRLALLSPDRVGHEYLWIFTSTLHQWGGAGSVGRGRHRDPIGPPRQPSLRA